MNNNRKIQSLSLTALLSLGAGMGDVLKNPANAQTPTNVKSKFSWIGNTFDGNEKLNPEKDWPYKHVQNFISSCEVDSEGSVFTESGWDEDGLTHGVYRDRNIIANDTTREINVKSVVDRNGARWSIQENTVVKEGTDVKITGLVKPVALAIDNKDGLLMVADDGNNKHVIEFYDSEGNLVRTVGVPGGVKATKGAVKPNVFWGIVGTGTDTEGNIYVCMSRWGTRIVSLKPDGETLDWEVQGLHFIDMPWFDPDSKGKYVYGKQEIYEMDYSKPPGEQAKLIAYTLDEDTYPDDIRGHNPSADGSVVFVGDIENQKFMFALDGLNGGDIGIYKFTPENGYIAVPAGKIPRLSGGPGFSIDKDGTFWELKGNKIFKTEIEGLDEKGNLKFAPAKEVAQLDGWVNLQRIYHEPKTDSLYVTGGKDENVIEFGGDVARYDKISSGSPELRWHQRIPYNWYDQELPIWERILGLGFVVAEDRVFIAYLNQETEDDKRNTGPVRILDAEQGNYLTTLRMQRSGWIDLWHPLSVTRLESGELVVLVEDDLQAKSAMYIVCDTGDCPNFEESNSTNENKTIENQNTKPVEEVKTDPIINENTTNPVEEVKTDSTVDENTTNPVEEVKTDSTINENTTNPVEEVKTDSTVDERTNPVEEVKTDSTVDERTNPVEEVKTDSTVDERTNPTQDEETNPTKVTPKKTRKVSIEKTKIVTPEGTKKVTIQKTKL